MSQYRSDRDAARQRIEALEAELAAREAELLTKGEEVAERDAEIERLRHQLVLGGILRSRTQPVNAAWATRAVLLTGTAMAGLLVGAVMLLRPAPVVVHVAPPVVVEAPRAVEPILADPGAVPVHADPVIEAAPIASALPTESEVRARLEQKVWAGQGSVDEIRMLKAICSHQGDITCRNRAAALLPKRGVF